MDGGVSQADQQRERLRLVPLFGLIRRRTLREQPLDLHEAFERGPGSIILIAGTATTITVLALSVVSYGAQRTVFANDPGAVTVKVTGHQWL
ncbi:hypothetical protein GWE18_14825 [Bradyrhizobium sp. CSA112]|uniref:hypothetical protein n=1 Tax=Bradyrhizobium sp. CSA112 TaxID=2699170 RepID=UPI0023B2019E|nr:hypothetical protein [Bradyrhizobium sp. CSA112]MDE5454103.1 hypothetical protein [Bradyrhizobium sp. CSA112]